jgi:hypothetical protein
MELCAADKLLPALGLGVCGKGFSIKHRYLVHSRRTSRVVTIHPHDSVLIASNNRDSLVGEEEVSLGHAVLEDIFCKHDQLEGVLLLVRNIINN